MRLRGMRAACGYAACGYAGLRLRGMRLRWTAYSVRGQRSGDGSSGCYAFIARASAAASAKAAK